MFSILDHTADLLIEGKGKTFESALEDLAKGMFSHMGKSEPKREVMFYAENENKDELIVSLLSDILSYCEINNFTPSMLEIVKYDGKKLLAKLKGENKKPLSIIKAVTYHMLEVKEENNIWKIRVLFDI